MIILDDQLVLLAVLGRINLTSEQFATTVPWHHRLCVALNQDRHVPGRFNRAINALPPERRDAVRRQVFDLDPALVSVLSPVEVVADAARFQGQHRVGFVGGIALATAARYGASILVGEHGRGREWQPLAERLGILIEVAREGPVDVDRRRSSTGLDTVIDLTEEPATVAHPTWRRDRRRPTVRSR